VTVEDGQRFFQGEILSNLVERQVARTTGNEFGFQELEHPYAVILSQDCDLEQDARVRQDPTLDDFKKRNGQLLHVLLVAASEFSRAHGSFAGSDVRKRVKQNKDERFHYLSAVPPEADKTKVGIPALILDFKQIFSLPTAELLVNAREGEVLRRARLAPQYLEHLSSRAAYFLHRVGLPKDHHDLPDGTASQNPTR